MTNSPTPIPTPIRIGSLYDFPSPEHDTGFEAAIRLGLDTAAAGGRIDRPVELISREGEGLPRGSERAVEEAFEDLDEDGVLLVIGPAISDNGLIACDLADEAGIACINYTGGERTRSDFMFHYSVGSLEEEPGILAARLAARGLRSAAVVRDRSPIGGRMAEFFDEARGTFGVDLTGSAAVSPIAEDLVAEVSRLRRSEPEALVYLGLGFTARSLAVALSKQQWSVPVVANSALMFGYREPSWRDDWRGWEYIDGVADDNKERQKLQSKLPQAAATPVGCAAFDMGRLVGEAIARAPHLTREGLKEGLERIKMLPATCGRDGTLMGFGQYDRAALKGHYLVLREWKDGETVQVDSA